MVTQASPSSTQGNGTIVHNIIDAIVDSEGRITCLCGRALRRTAGTSTNLGRVFWVCGKSTREDKGCNFFKWDDQLPPHFDPEASPSQLNSTPSQSPASTLKRQRSPASSEMASPTQRKRLPPKDYKTDAARARRLAALKNYDPEIDDRPSQASSSQPSQPSPSKFKPAALPSTPSQSQAQAQYQAQAQNSRLPAPDFTMPGSQSTAPGPSQPTTAPIPSQTNPAEGSAGSSSQTKVNQNGEDEDAQYWPIDLDEVESLLTPRTPALSVRSQGMMTPPASASGGGSSQMTAVHQPPESPLMGKGKGKEIPRASRTGDGTSSSSASASRMGTVPPRDATEGPPARPGELQNMIGDIMQVVQAYGGLDVPARILQLERRNAEQARLIETLRVEVRDAKESRDNMQESLKNYLMATMKK
ncbi:hypothetical protein OF83DRAFT_1144470 [Amylostereum chailletii]|nr:hypothetical protein OF83DRAFT_1144470 [Amylostereum chailletii]